MADLAGKTPTTSGRRPGRGCNLGDLFGLLGESYVLDILHVFIAESRPRRFTELQKTLMMSPNTLTLRLNRLVAAGFLKRTAYNEIPPRVEYELTRKASELEAAFRVFDGWSKTNNLRPELTVSTH